MRTAPRAIEKAVQFQPETVSSFSQNRCPVWPEYAAMDDAVDLFQAGRYNWRPIACERLVAAVNSIPAVYAEKYNYQKEKDALKASLVGGHRHQVDSDSQKI